MRIDLLALLGLRRPPPPECTRRCVEQVDGAARALERLAEDALGKIETTRNGGGGVNDDHLA